MAGKAETTATTTTTTANNNNGSGGGGYIRTVTLRGCDGVRVRVSAGTMAAASATARGRLDEAIGRTPRHAAVPDNVLINVPGVSRPVLARVADYCDRHYGLATGGGENSAPFAAPEGYGFDDPLARFDDELMDGADADTVVDLLRAATFLRIEKLADLASREVAACMRGRTVEQIREVFGIVNDYTKEEEQDVRKENSWAFDTYND
uniref:SKP1-like protein n=1 Tax=Oryza punctata TaxID=4537 RepID=A0A0E0JXJ1_ORYPU